MRLAFICAALEPGRDGVGDYTRLLAGELIRQGHDSVIVSLNDTHILTILSERQTIENISVPVLRLPGRLAWSRRVAEARGWLDAFQPDWTSLQFVPFGFHPKGFCFGLGKSLATINAKKPWHIMFHELWVGLGRNPSVKHRLWGTAQRAIIKNLVHRLRPQAIHTQAEPYRMALDREHIGSSILPLFGNIPLTPGGAWEDLLESKLARRGVQPGRNNFYLAGVFGAVHPEWDVEMAVKTISPLIAKQQKRLAVVFFGKSRLDEAAVGRLNNQLQGRAEIVWLGEQPPAVVSRMMQTLDLGLATSPVQLIQKSGSVVAMLEHGLPVLVTRSDGPSGRLPSTPETNGLEILTPEKFESLRELPARKHVTPPIPNVGRTVDALLKAFHKA